MIANAAQLVWRLVSPERIWGPVFAKELRVSSRRRRNYVLRFVYLALLTLFVAMVWATAASVPHTGSTAYTISRMSVVGKSVITTVIWFQFCAIQMIAVIMLSNAISDEIYHKTLAVLMTTPINSFQIIVGKLFSKLWQLLVLVGVSLPVLATVRVFGGVPWEFVVSGVCMTLTAAIFAGSVSIYFSIGTRRAYAVILKTLFTGAAFYILLPECVGWALMNSVSGVEKLIAARLLANPFAALSFATATMISPMAFGSVPFFSWALHCAVMLAASALVLAVAIWKVRKVALSQATGQAGSFRKSKQPKAQKPAETGSAVAETPTGRIRRIKGSPIVWKELLLHTPRASRRTTAIAVAFAVGALLISYGVCAHENCLGEDFTHVIYAEIFVILGLIDTAVLSATTITSEKESRSWPILLATPLSDSHIIFGKACGVLRRVLPVWLFLAGHVVVFTLVDMIHPIALVHMGMLVTWMVVFFTGSGLYFSACFRRTTTAVVMNFALALTLWLIVPMVVGMLTELTSSYEDDLTELTAAANPVVQTAVIMEAAGGLRNASLPYRLLDYDGPGFFHANADDVTGGMFAFLLVYGTAGYLFAWRAEKRLRRNIF